MYAVVKTKTGAKLVNHVDHPAYFKKGNSQSGAEGITCPKEETLYGMFSNRQEAERHVQIATEQKATEQKATT